MKKNKDTRRKQAGPPASTQRGEPKCKAFGGKDTIEYIPEDDTGAIDEKIKKIKKIKDKLKKCQKEKEEYLAGWQRAKADLINYKKEQEQKISDYYRFANQGLILEILMVLDSFELALKHIDKAAKGLPRLPRFGEAGGKAGEPRHGREEIAQIYNQLKNTLKNQGLEEIEAIGEKFNPELHESVEEIKSKEKQGIVVEEIQKGYKLNNKVIRPSKVKISK